MFSISITSAPHRSESRELEEVEAKEEVVEEKENGVEIAPRVSLIVAFYIEHLVNREIKNAVMYFGKENTCYNFKIKISLRSR